MDSFFNIPLAGGLTIGIILSINILVVRYVMMYIRETREEYSRRLTRAVIELEVQKTTNVRLEYEIDRLRFFKKSTDTPE